MYKIKLTNFWEISYTASILQVTQPLADTRANTSPCPWEVTCGRTAHKTGGERGFSEVGVGGGYNRTDVVAGDTVTLMEIFTVTSQRPWLARRGRCNSSLHCHTSSSPPSFYEGIHTGLHLWLTDRGGRITQILYSKPHMWGNFMWLEHLSNDPSGISLCFWRKWENPGENRSRLCFVFSLSLSAWCAVCYSAIFANHQQSPWLDVSKSYRQEPQENVEMPYCTKYAIRPPGKQ